MNIINNKYINIVFKNDNYSEILKKESDELGYEYIYIDGNKCMTIDDLFTEFSVKFKFPDYFGYNWPAFDECINDLNWLPACGYIVLIGNGSKILSNNKQDFETFIKVLVNAVSEWVNGRNFDSFPTSPTPFYLFMECSKESEFMLKELLSNRV